MHDERFPTSGGDGARREEKQYKQALNAEAWLDEAGSKNTERLRVTETSGLNRPSIEPV